MELVRAWLDAKNLSRYVSAFEDQGYDSLQELFALSSGQADDAARVIGILPGHVKRFKDALREGKGRDSRSSVDVNTALGGAIAALDLNGHVVAHSLVRCAELNGLHGKVVSVVDDRVHVDFGEPHGTKALRFTNLLAHETEQRPSRWQRCHNAGSTPAAAAAAASAALDEEVLFAKEGMASNPDANADTEPANSGHSWKRDQHWNAWSDSGWHHNDGWQGSCGWDANADTEPAASGHWWESNQHRNACSDSGWHHDDGWKGSCGWDSGCERREEPEGEEGWSEVHVADLPEHVRVDEFLQACRECGVSVDPSQRITISYYKQRARQTGKEEHRAAPGVESECAQTHATATAQEHRFGDAVPPPPPVDERGVHEEPTVGEVPQSAVPDVGAQAATEPRLVVRKTPGCYIRTLRVMASDSQHLFTGRTKVWLRGQLVRFAKPTYKPSVCVVEETLEQLEGLELSPEELRDIAAAPPPQPHELMALLPPPPTPLQLLPAAVAAPPERLVRADAASLIGPSMCAAAPARLMTGPIASAARPHRGQPRQFSSAPVDATPAHPYNMGALAPTGPGRPSDSWSPTKAIAVYDFDSTSYNAHPSSTGDEYMSLRSGEVVYTSYVPELDAGWVKVSKLDRRTNAPLIRGWVPQGFIKCL